MIEAGSAEALPQAVGKAVLVVEDDAGNDGGAFSAKAARAGGAQPPQRVGDAAETAAASDDVSLVEPQHDVNTATPQPRALVEAVPRPTRLLEHRECAEHCALGRRAPLRELE